MEVFVGACSTNDSAFGSSCRRIAGAIAVAAIAILPALTFAGGAQAQPRLSRSIERPDKALHDLVESSLLEIERCVRKEEHQDARSRGRRIPDPSIKKSDADDGIVCPIETNL